jgi:hypothetical protein
MRGSRLGLALLAACGAAFGGACGEEDPAASGTSVSRSELGSAVARICSDYREAAGSLPPRDPAPAKFEERLSRLQRRAIAQLHELRPRGDDDKAYHDFVGAQEYAFYAQATLRGSGRSGEGDSAPAQTARQAVDRAQRLAFRLGFDSCTAE